MDKLERFFGKGWYQQLKEFTDSQKFKKIGEEIQKYKNEGLLIVPENKDIFRCFSECPWEKLHTVILALEPHSNTRDTILADGLAFSSRNALIPPYELEELFTLIEDEIYFKENRNYKFGETCDLSYLANQGVLLLNVCLTRCNKSVKLAEHYDLWKPFITEVLTKINDHKDSIGFILMGEYAKTYEKLLTNQTFAVYTSEHPVEAITNTKDWSDNSSFLALTSFQLGINNIKIEW